MKALTPRDSKRLRWILWTSRGLDFACYVLLALSFFYYLTEFLPLAFLALILAPFQWLTFTSYRRKVLVPAIKQLGLQLS